MRLVYSILIELISLTARTWLIINTYPPPRVLYHLLPLCKTFKHLMKNCFKSRYIYYRCKTYSSIPDGCKLEKVDKCCSELRCNNTSNVLIATRSSTDTKQLTSGGVETKVQTSGKSTFERNIALGTKAMRTSVLYLCIFNL